MSHRSRGSQSQSRDQSRRPGNNADPNVTPVATGEQPSFSATATTTNTAATLGGPSRPSTILPPLQSALASRSPTSQVPSFRGILNPDYTAPDRPSLVPTQTTTASQYYPQPDPSSQPSAYAARYSPLSVGASQLSTQSPFSGRARSQTTAATHQRPSSSYHGLQPLSTEGLGRRQSVNPTVSRDSVSMNAPGQAGALQIGGQPSIPESAASERMPSKKREDSERRDSAEMMTMATEEGHFTVALDTQSASKSADEKRRRNAGASARFRQRRKEREQLSTQENEILKADLRDASEDVAYYRRERDYFRSVVERGPEAGRHRNRPLSPRLTRARRSSHPSDASFVTSPTDVQGNYQYEQYGDPGTAGRNTRRRLSENTMRHSYPQPAGPQPSPTPYSSQYAATYPSVFVTPDYQHSTRGPTNPLERHLFSPHMQSQNYQNTYPPQLPPTQSTAPGFYPPAYRGNPPHPSPHSTYHPGSPPHPPPPPPPAPQPPPPRPPPSSGR